MCCLLTLYFLVLYIYKILTRSLPLWIQNEALVVLGLGKNAGPCLKQRGGIVNSS